MRVLELADEPAGTAREQGAAEFDDALLYLGWRTAKMIMRGA